MRNLVRIIALGCSLLVPACGSEDPTSVEVNVAGTWTTNAGACVGADLGTCTLTMVLGQSGTVVTGTGTLVHATRGLQGPMTITGSASSNSAVTLVLSGTAFDADPDDTVQFAGTRTDATTITGTFTSSGSITGAFTFKRQ